MHLEKDANSAHESYEHTTAKYTLAHAGVSARFIANTLCFSSIEPKSF